MAAEDNDWFMNLFNSIIFMYLGAFIGYAIPIGPILVLLGDPEWFYTTMTGLNMLPPDATSWETSFY